MYEQIRRSDQFLLKLQCPPQSHPQVEHNGHHGNRRISVLSLAKTFRGAHGSHRGMFVVINWYCGYKRLKNCEDRRIPSGEVSVVYCFLFQEILLSTVNRYLIVLKILIIKSRIIVICTLIERNPAFLEEKKLQKLFTHLKCTSESKALATRIDLLLVRNEVNSDENSLKEIH